MESMKIIQTFWTGRQVNNVSLDIKAGWLSPEYHWMSWALSCLLLRKLYSRVELYTDEIGKVILIDILKLPYTDVHIIFDESFKIHPELFSLAKIRTYSLQEEPFIHVDGDLFIWKPLPDALLNAGLLSSNLEVNLFFNREILDDVEKHFVNIPGHLKGVNSNENIFSSNAGIVGGSNHAFIKEYCDCAFQFVESNQANLSKIKVSNLNFLIEQVSLFYLAKERGVSTSYFMDEPVVHPLYQDYLRFADVPNVGMIHNVGGCKRNPFVLDHLARRLRLEYPGFFYNILNSCKKESIPLRNQLYEHLDLDNLLSWEELLDRKKFINSLNSAGDIGIPKIEFHNAYKRTLDAIQFCYKRSFKAFQELSDFIENEKVPEQIEEIFLLEKQRNNKILRLYQEVQEGSIYGQEYQQYQLSTLIFRTSEDLSKSVSINKNTSLLDLGWNWVLDIKPKDDKVKLEQKLKDIFELERESHIVTLSFNVLTMGVVESYYDDLDAIILHSLQKPKTVLEILIEVKNHFEDDIPVENPEYQDLIFDTLKRLSFANIIIVKENQ